MPFIITKPTDADFEDWYVIVFHLVQYEAKKRLVKVTPISLLQIQREKGKKILNGKYPEEFKEKIDEYITIIDAAIESTMYFYGSRRSEQIWLYGYELEIWDEIFS